MASDKTSATVLEIASDSLRAGVCPSQGGSLSYFQFRRGNTWHDLFQNGTLPGNEGQKAFFVMAPLTARTENGRFPWLGKDFDLEASWHPHALHCWAPRLDWKNCVVTPTRASVRVNSCDHPQVRYPSPFEIEIIYEILGDELVVSTTITNVGNLPMPASGGSHPMILKKVMGSDIITLQFNAPDWFPPRPDLPDEPMPIGHIEVVPEALDFKHERQAPSGFDCTLSGWDAQATVRWPDVGLTLNCRDLEFNSELFHYWNQPGRDVWAIEPLLGIADAPNLVAQRWPNTGLVTLNPGEHVFTCHGFQVIA